MKNTVARIIRSKPEYGIGVCDEQDFFLVCSGKRLFQRIKLEDSSTQKNLDISADWKSIRFTEFNQLSLHEEALKRGVKVRIITEKHEGDPFESLYPSLFNNDYLFEIRYTNPPIPIRCAIYDKKKINLSMRSHLDQTTPFLWSNNFEFAKVLIAFFEQIWKKASANQQLI